MPELLLELGCEELPATAVRKAYTQLAEEIQSRLEASSIGFGARTEMGTPRRLIVSFEEVAERQADQEKVQRGPSVKAAYDEQHNPTPALLGFCKSQGLDPGDLTVEGEYVWAKRVVDGLPTAEVLRTLLPEAIRALSFDKSMRWGSGRMRFARPVRWILASFAGQTVEFEIEGVASGAESRGHRFECPEAFHAVSLAELLAGLRARRVEPDPANRERAIRQQAQKVCTGVPVLTDVLVDENVFLTEWPAALEGSFESAFLELPRPVLVTAMAKHEKFFPVEGPDGKIANKFISIRNGGAEDAVREGNAWVLNARFNDARFFYRQDSQSKLVDFLDRTAHIVFQDSLGTVRLRADRLAGLCVEVAKDTCGEAEEQALAYQAGLLAKADLSSGLVSELPALQGIIGAEYARREGLPEPVCAALASQYDLSEVPGADSVASKTSLRLIMADQIDKLAGFLGIGLIPSGSSDPYGLRRAATVLIESVLRFPFRVSSLGPMVHAAFRGYAAQGIELDKTKAMQGLKTLLCARYEAIFESVRYDILKAAVRDAEDEACLDPRGVLLSIRTLEIMAADLGFVQTATRPLNIVSAAIAKGAQLRSESALASFDRSAVDSQEGLHVYEALLKAEQQLIPAVKSENAEQVAQALFGLREPINAFFDSTMIMVDDESVRLARLNLLQACCRQLLIAGDFSKIVQEGN